MDDYFKTLPRNPEPKHYWHIYRKHKSKPGQWVFVCDFAGTKAAVAKFWNTHFRDGDHRLKHLLKYPTKAQ